MADLRDVLKKLQGGSGGQGGYGPRTGWWKKPTSQKAAKFRPYRFGVDKAYMNVKNVHRTGSSPPFVACEGEACSLCKAWQDLRNMAFSDQLNKEAMLKKADEIRPQTKYEFMMLDSDNPDRFLIVELPEGAAKKLFHTAAASQGWCLPYPSNPRRDATPEEIEKADSEFQEFQMKVDAGMNALCGPTGRNIVVTYNPFASDKREFYTIMIEPGLQKTLPIAEDDKVQSPMQVQANVDAARRRKEEKVQG